MNGIKIVVAHPYQQHSFRTAAAIKEAGCLYRYVTTVYDKKRSLTALAKRVLRGDTRKRADGRRSDQLTDREIKQFCELKSLLLLLLYRIDKKRYVYNWLNAHILRSFNKKLAAYVCKNDVDVVVLYDTVSLECIQRIRKSGKKVTVVLDMSAPSMPYMDSFFRKSVKADREISEFLLQEIDSEDYQKRLRNASAEIAEADYFLAASEFTKKSLEYVGVPAEKVFLCRYGIAVDTKEAKPVAENEQLQCAFIGNVTQKKGFHTFAKVADAMCDSMQFHVVGAYHPDDPIYVQNADKCRYHGYVTRNRVLELCEQIDLVLFPSLADGFGLSVIEAMSKGVVPIVSRNAGVSDLITDGENGFVMDYWDSEKPMRVCKALLCDRQKLAQMQEKAWQTACCLTWEKYNDAIRSALAEIVLRNKNEKN